VRFIAQINTWHGIALPYSLLSSVVRQYCLADEEVIFQEIAHSKCHRYKSRESLLLNPINSWLEIC